MNKGGEKITPVFSDGRANGFTFTNQAKGGKRVTLVDDEGKEITISGGGGGGTFTFDEFSLTDKTLTLTLSGETKTVDLTSLTEDLQNQIDEIINNGIVENVTYNSTTKELTFTKNDETTLVVTLPEPIDLSEYYTRTETDEAIETATDGVVKSVNGIIPDTDGNVEVSGGGTIFANQIAFTDLDATTSPKSLTLNTAVGEITSGMYEASLLVKSDITNPIYDLQLSSRINTTPDGTTHTDVVLGEGIYEGGNADYLTNISSNLIPIDETTATNGVIHFRVTIAAGAGILNVFFIVKKVGDYIE